MLQDRFPRPQAFQFIQAIDARYLDDPIDWIWPGSSQDPLREDRPYHYTSDAKDNHEPSQHGSCMLSKAIGAIGTPQFSYGAPQGISRRAKATIVRIPRRKDDSGGPFYDHVVVDGFLKILDKVVEKGLQKKAVISMSFTFFTGDDYPVPPPKGSIFESLFDVFKQLIDNDVVILVSPGNSGLAVLPNVS
jgi:hypothetical protein